MATYKQLKKVLRKTKSAKKARAKQRQKQVATASVVRNKE